MTSPERFRQQIDERVPLLLDGATGTELYNRGVFINRCFEEANLSNPALVLGLHRDYVNAGSGALLSNSWGANQFKLAGHGLQEKTREINVAAAGLAREAAGEELFVGGSVGPLGRRVEPWGPLSVEQAFNAFRLQIESLLQGGVDFIYLETFSDLIELEQAIRAAKAAAPALAVAASVTINLSGELVHGGSLETAIRSADQWGADIVGLNCSVGPQPTLTAIERIKTLTSRPLCVKPNAGLPREIDGRMIYMSTPEYVATFTRNFLQTGVLLVGGCCGTTPAHVRNMAQAYRHFMAMHAGGGTRISVEKPRRQAESEPSTEQQRVAFADKSRWSAKLARGEKVYALELLPPSGVNMAPLLEKTQKVKQAGLDVINIPDGPRASSRMSTSLAAVMIEQRVGIETILHYTCRDRNLIGMQSDLLGIHAIGLRNVLLITGDPPKIGNYPNATGVFDVDAIGLTRVAHQLNGGIDVGNRPIGEPTALSIGVGVNPVHRSFDYEMQRFEQKVAAGAEWAITQPIFDAADMFRFLEYIEKRNIRIPIIAGIWPLTSLSNAEFMNNEVPGISIPKAVIERMAQARSRQEGMQFGVEIAVQLRRTLDPAVQGFQISAPFGRIDMALQVAEPLPVEGRK
ncbi:MAG: bifunctional homocysteine S-methyltransferase/methylenetetrahydrofolate reductase [Spirochaetaceae bacterium]|nr:MAG: bifunctional homocysteine S-methyltransferase/methylenetetrahydrofolate reductase [Spirochaetaceae bacterium]